MELLQTYVYCSLHSIKSSGSSKSTFRNADIKRWDTTSLDLQYEMLAIKIIVTLLAIVIELDSNLITETSPSAVNLKFNKS